MMGGLAQTARSDDGTVLWTRRTGSGDILRADPPTRTP